MADRTGGTPVHIDEYGVERFGEAPPKTFVDKVRDRSRLFDRLFVMQQRYSEQGGNQYAAGVTYFSVLAVVPLLMVLFAVVGVVLRGSDDLYGRMEDVIRQNLGGEFGATVIEIVQSAVNQTSTVASVALLVGMWTGLYWMTTLRRGMTSMWCRSLVPERWVIGKIRDLVVLVGMAVMIILTFLVTAVGSSGVLVSVLDATGLRGSELDTVFIRTGTTAIGLLANWILFFWMLKALPFGSIPSAPAVRGAVIGAVGLELIKTFGSMFFATAVRNPAGAMFGPVIGLMVILYLLWRMTLYLGAWTATSAEGLATLEIEAPAPAVVMVRDSSLVKSSFLTESEERKRGTGTDTGTSKRHP